jgi:hypothetical protein
MNDTTNWKKVYGMLMLALLVQIVLYYGLTQYFS